METYVDKIRYVELDLISRKKIINATKCSTDYLAYAIEKTRKYCEKQLCKAGMPRNSTNAYVTWRSMTTLTDGRVSHDIFIAFRVVTIGNKEAARQVVDALVPDEDKIPNDTRDLMCDFDLSYVMTEILLKRGGAWMLDDEDVEDIVCWMTKPAMKMFSDVTFKGREYFKEMFYDNAVNNYLVRQNPMCLIIPEMDGLCESVSG